MTKLPDVAIFDLLYYIFLVCKIDGVNKLGNIFTLFLIKYKSLLCLSSSMLSRIKAAVGPIFQYLELFVVN